METETNVVEEVAQESPAQEAQPEKTLTQSEVNKLIGRAKAESAEKARRQLEQQYQLQLEQIETKQPQRNETESRETDADAIYQQVQEKFNQEMQQRQLETEMSNVANQYVSKMDLAKGEYEDFSEVTQDFDATAFPQLVYLVAGIEHGGHVMYELAKNPLKLEALDSLARKSPKIAQRELQKLAASIATNRAAQQDASQQGTNAPLDRLTPGNVTGSNGKSTIKDLKSASWLRG
jgi:hypothetical protein